MIEDSLPDLGPTAILVSILETLKEVDVPIITLLDSGKNARELQIDYDIDNQSVKIKLREINE